jgi:CheY-like chemotaxis protein
MSRNDPQKKRYKILPKSVLLVEDSQLNAMLIRGLLPAAGLTVMVCGDAEAALVSLQELTPDLILMDVQLPGMSGLELTGLLKSDPLRYKIPIVALTANNSPEDRRAMMDAGCEGFVSKPVDPAQFAGDCRVVRCGNKVGHHHFFSFFR